MDALTQPLRDEHAELLPLVESLRAAADHVGDVEPRELLGRVDAALQFLTHQLIPHAAAEDAALYPVVDRLLGAAHATHTMSLDHVEVGRLTADLAALRDRVATGAITHQEEDELRLVLYGLFVLVRLHFHKEEAAYLPVLDAGLTPDSAAAMFEAMEAAARREKAVAV